MSLFINFRYFMITWPYDDGASEENRCCVSLLRCTKRNTEMSARGVGFYWNKICQNIETTFMSNVWIYVIFEILTAVKCRFCFSELTALKMEAVFSSETFVYTRLFTRRHNQKKNMTLRTHTCIYLYTRWSVFYYLSLWRHTVTSWIITLAKK
jgi:hypothetical protein